MYLESAERDPNCEIFCGPKFIYMRYDGDPFCVTAANVAGRWIYIDLQSPTTLSTEPPIVVTCAD